MVPSWSIRQAVSEDAAEIAKVHVDSWRSTYAGIVPGAFLDDLSYAKSEARWLKRLANPTAEYVIFVAQDEEGRVIGFVDGGSERSGDDEYDGEIYALYLLQNHQGRGLGTKLFRRVITHLLTFSNIHSVMVWVLQDNPSKFFYESMGGELVRQKTMEIGNKPLRACVCLRVA
jgi:GNAT superfamily N-acetyltransferase